MTANDQSSKSQARRILISAALNTAGGVETHLQQLCRLLVEQRAEVVLVARAAAPDNAIVRNWSGAGLRLITTPFSKNLCLFRLSTAYALASLPLQLRRRSFDVLYAVGPCQQDVSRFTVFLSHFVRRGGHILANPVGGCTDQFLRTQAGSILTGIIAETPRQAFNFRHAYRVEVPVAAIPHIGFSFNPSPRRHRALTELRVAFLGRLEEYKGIYLLLEMWPKLAIQPARLAFFGWGSEAALLQEQIRRRGLTHQVQVGSYKSEQVSKIFAEVDLVVLPSIAAEGLPLVLLEAMAHGVPFVATNVGMVPTLAEGNPDVRVVPPDGASVKAALEEMAGEIRAGRIQSDRLQEYHRLRYSNDRIATRWIDALLNADNFWREGGGILASGDMETERHGSERNVDGNRVFAP